MMKFDDFQFHRFCTDGDCKAYNDGFDAMWAQRDCLKGGPANLACVGIVAQALGSYCSYSDSTCSLEMTGNCFMGFSFISKCDNAFPFALVDSSKFLFVAPTDPASTYIFKEGESVC